MSDTNGEARFERGAVVDERYELIERLEGVGLGETWRARDPNVPTRIFTLKPLGLADGDEVPSALAGHVRELRTLRHASIVPATGRGVWNGRVYLVMGPLDGVSLPRHLVEMRADGAPLSLPVIDALFRQIAAPLAATHRLPTPVAHGDLHPEVIVIARSDEGVPVVRLMDFGLAPFVDARAAAQGRWFTAPERESAPRATPAMDVFSLGKVLRVLLEEPSSTAPATVMADGFRGRQDVPGAVWKLVDKATDADPRRRHESVAALLDDLKEAWKAPPEASSIAKVVSGVAPPAAPVVQPPRLFGEAPVLRLPPLPVPAEAPAPVEAPVATSNAAVENPWATEVLRRRALIPADAIPAPRATTVTPEARAENPWATEVLRRRAVVPVEDAMPTVIEFHRKDDATGVLSEGAFGAVTQAPVSPTNPTLVGAPAVSLDDQVTTIERVKRRDVGGGSHGPPMAVAAGPAQAYPPSAPTPGNAQEGATLITRRQATPKRGLLVAVLIAGALLLAGLAFLFAR